MMDAPEALERLKSGNERYRASGVFTGAVDAHVRETLSSGQSPFAVVVCCSDSRVIPEAIFETGLGELFVIRVAGNVMGEHELGSIEYAVEHLGVRLVVVLGHTHCGAVGAALAGGAAGHTASLTDEIRRAIGDEHDEREASCANARAGAAYAAAALTGSGARAIAALYDIETGAVSWL